MSGEPLIEGTRGWLVHVGLGTPFTRAFCAATAVGIAAYLLKVPGGAFDEEGNMRPSTFVSQAPTATCTHFLVVPATAAAVTYLFT